MHGIDVWDYPHPLTAEGRRRHKLLLVGPTPIEEVKAWIGVAEVRQIQLVNGNLVEPGHLVKDGDIVSFHNEPKVETVAFFFLDAALFAGFELAVASFIVSAATSIAVNALVSAVFAPDRPDSNNVSLADVPNAYSVSSANNQVRAYQPLPLLMGNVRYSPDVDARPWSQFVDDPENVRTQTVTETRSLTAATRTGFNTATDTGLPAFRPYPENGSQVGYLRAWESFDGGLTFETENGCWISGAFVWVTLHYRTDTGLYQRDATDGDWVSFESATTQQMTITVDVPETTQELTQVFNFGLGDLVIDDLRFGQTKIDQFAGVTASFAAFGPDATTMGTDAAHPNPPYGGNTWKLNVISVEGGELRQNAQVHDSGWVTRDFYGDDCEFIQVDLTGRLYYSGNEGPSNASCAFEIEYRPEGGGAWTQVFAPTLTNGDAFPVRETFGWPVALGTAYEVRVRKSTGDTTDARLTQEFEFTQVKFFRPEPVEPNNPFTQHPAQNRYSVAVRASGQISGTIDNLNGYGRSKCWVWTGGTATAPTTPVGAAGWSWRNTENPAWWYLYYSMGGFRRSAADAGSPLNGKGWCMGPEKADGPRMFGAGLRTERIDLEALAAWAAFCDAYNLRFNAVLREQSNVAEVLTRIARIGRASPTWQQGKLGVVWEDPADVPVAAFGVTSIEAGSMTIGYIGYNAPDEIIASYTNPNDDWKEDEVRKTVPGVVLPNSEVTISLWGCKYKEQAQREVNLLAARQFYQRRRVTFNTSQEGLPILRGDVILLGHDMTNWAFSSRCGDATAGSSLALVRRVDPLPGTTLNVLVVKPDGTMQTGTAAMPTESTHILALAGGWAPVDFGEFPDAVPEDWVVHLSSESEVGKRMRVVAVEPGDGRTIQITCTDERPEIYDYEVSGTPVTVEPSEEELIARVRDLSVTRDACTGVVSVEWTCDNCRGATVGTGGATLTVWGERLVMGVLPEGASVSVAIFPEGRELQAIRSVGDSGTFVV